ncbi:hypothetical protein LTR27_012798 [Elasticomyces elasticus]|nr:hypothetical protein LTR27_012798 [Elasticomyces elasticus]
MAETAARSSKRLKLSDEDHPKLDFPHDELILPLVAVGHDEIRVLVVAPGEVGSPLMASVELIKLQPKVSASQDAIAIADEEDDVASKDDNKINTLLAETKYVRAGDSLFAVPLTYTGNGTEFLDKHIDDTLAALNYEAISYVWGAPAYSHTISLTGHGVLRITESLHDALQRLRSPDSTRTLWADAICINQADMTERSTQVSMMDRVYQQASGVPVWLGPSRDTDALAFAAITAYLGDARGDDVQDVWARLESCLRTSGCCPCCAEPFDTGINLAADALLAVGRLLQRPWFSRLWVVQETSTSARLRDHATVLCGKHHISYLDLRDAIRMIQSDASPQGTLRSSPGPPEDTVGPIMKLWAGINSLRDWYTDIEDWPPNYLLRTLAGMSNRQCSNPLDRVYAIRPLLGLTDELTLIPDYRLSSVEVFRRFTIVLLAVFDRHGHTDSDQPWALLALAGTIRGKTLDAGWPSWVPNFDAFTSRSRSVVELYTRNLWLEVPQFLSAPALFLTRLRQSSAELQVKGKCFAKVREIFSDTEYPVLSETHSDRISDMELSIFRAWYVRCLHCIGQTALVNEEVIAHSTTFLACRTQLAHLPREMEDVEGAVDHSGGWLFPDKWPEDVNLVREHFMLLSASEQSPPDKARVIARIELDGNQGLDDYCWVPPRALEGDRICVIAGATFPFVIRELVNGCSEILGDAYLANTTLKQALGGGGKSRWNEDIYEDVSHPPTDDWNTEDESMQSLIAGMDWITLQ